MIEQLEIKGYRCFEHFRMSGLGHVNLLVGKNCSGKTALLEAIETLVASPHRLNALRSPLVRRGEVFPVGDERPKEKGEYDVAHLFLGHQMRLGSSFEMASRGGDRAQSIKATVVKLEGPLPQKLFPGSGNEPYEGELPFRPIALKVESSAYPRFLLIPLTSRGGLLRLPDILPDGWVSGHDEDRRDVTLVTADSLAAYTASQYWKSIVLTDDEQLVLEAMRVLEPRIERIAFVGVRPVDSRQRRGGVLVLLKGASSPVPIGTLGDGMWRMFCIAVALIRSKGGVLLVDEIDSGLHYSVMEEMWRMVIETSQRLGVQVFATTHSSDCLNSLASICQNAEPGLVSLQRIEPGRTDSVAYSEGEIMAAARHGIETR